MSQSATNDLMTQDEAAKYLGLQPRTLQTWRTRGDTGLKFVRLGGSVRGPVRYRKRDLDKWLEGRVREHT